MNFSWTVKIVKSEWWHTEVTEKSFKDKESYLKFMKDNKLDSWLSADNNFHRPIEDIIQQFQQSPRNFMTFRPQRVLWLFDSPNFLYSNSTENSNEPQDDKVSNSTIPVKKLSPSLQIIKDKIKQEFKDKADANKKKELDINSKLNDPNSYLPFKWQKIQKDDLDAIKDEMKTKEETRQYIDSIEEIIKEVHSSWASNSIKEQLAKQYHIAQERFRILSRT